MVGGARVPRGRIRGVMCRAKTDRSCASGTRSTKYVISAVAFAALLVLALPVAAIASPSIRTVDDVAIGPASGTNHVSWNDGAVLWDQSDDSVSSVRVWDRRSRRSKVLAISKTQSFSGAFWHRGRAYWYVSDSGQLVSCDPTVGKQRVELVHQGMRRIVAAGDRVAWLEPGRQGDGWRVMSMRLPRGRAELVAEAQGERVELSISERMLVWVVSDAGEAPCRTVNVHRIAADLRLAKQAQVLPVATGAAANYYPYSLGIDEDRIAWQAERDGDTFVHTWQVGEKTPRCISTRAQGIQSYGDVSRALVSDGAVAWLQGGAFTVWRPGDQARTVVPAPHAGEGTVITFAAGQIAWIRPTGKHAVITVHDLRTGDETRVAVTGPIVEPTGRRDAGELSLHGSYASYLARNRDDSVELRISGPTAGRPLLAKEPSSSPPAVQDRTTWWPVGLAALAVATGALLVVMWRRKGQA